MITIDKKPPELFFAGNPVLYRIHSDNLVITPGQKCSFSLVVWAADTVAGHTLKFAFPFKTITFTTALIPDDSGLQIQTASNSAFFAIWAQTLFDCFQSNFEISSRFQITLETATSYNRTISFTAFEQGTSNNCTITHNLITVTVMAMVSGLNPMVQGDFGIVGGIWDANMRQLAQDIKPVDSDGNVTFDFSEYLSSLLDFNSLNHFTFPFSDNLLNVFSDFPMQFYAGFAERYGGEIKKLHFDDLKTAFPGGLNRETLVFYNSQNVDFFSVEENQKIFMTWAPVVKTSDMLVPEKLYFFVGPKPTYDLISLQVKVWFTNGTFQMLESEIDVSANEVVECSVGYQALELYQFSPLVVSSWEVWMQISSNPPLSETRTFIMDHQVHENERIFIFQNSFGRAYDVVRFTGKGAVKIELDFSTGNSDLSEDYTAFNAPGRKFNPNESQKMMANTGWIDREMKDYLREMLLSRQVFEYKDGLLYPIVITTNSVKEHFVDDIYLYSLEVEYDRAYRDFFFSRFNPWMIFSIGRTYCEEYSEDYS